MMMFNSFTVPTITILERDDRTAAVVAFSWRQLALAGKFLQKEL